VAVERAVAEDHQRIGPGRTGSDALDPGLERLTHFDRAVHDQVVLAVHSAPGGRLEPVRDEGGTAGLLRLPRLGDHRGRGDHPARPHRGCGIPRGGGEFPHERGIRAAGERTDAPPSAHGALVPQ